MVSAPVDAHMLKLGKATYELDLQCSDFFAHCHTPKSASTSGVVLLLVCFVLSALLLSPECKCVCVMGFDRPSCNVIECDGPVDPRKTRIDPS